MVVAPLGGTPLSFNQSAKILHQVLHSLARHASIHPVLDEPCRKARGLVGEGHARTIRRLGTHPRTRGIWEIDAVPFSLLTRYCIGSRTRGQALRLGHRQRRGVAERAACSRGTSVNARLIAGTSATICPPCAAGPRAYIVARQPRRPAPGRQGRAPCVRDRRACSALPIRTRREGPYRQDTHVIDHSVATSEEHHCFAVLGCKSPPRLRSA